MDKPDPQLVVDVVRAARDETPYVRSLPLHMAAHHAFPHAQALAARIEELETDVAYQRAYADKAWQENQLQTVIAAKDAHIEQLKAASGALYDAVRLEATMTNKYAERRLLAALNAYDAALREDKP